MGGHTPNHPVDPRGRRRAAMYLRDSLQAVIPGKRVQNTINSKWRWREGRKTIKISKDINVQKNEMEKKIENWERQRNKSADQRGDQVCWNQRNSRIAGRRYFWEKKPPGHRDRLSRLPGRNQSPHVAAEEMSDADRQG